MALMSAGMPGRTAANRTKRRSRRDLLHTPDARYGPTHCVQSVACRVGGKKDELGVVFRAHADQRANAHERLHDVCTGEEGEPAFDSRRLIALASGSIEPTRRMREIDPLRVFESPDRDLQSGPRAAQLVIMWWPGGPPGPCAR
jgi:hypothetical protein